MENLDVPCRKPLVQDFYKQHLYISASFLQTFPNISARNYTVCLQYTCVLICMSHTEGIFPASVYLLRLPSQKSANCCKQETANSSAWCISI